MAIKDLLIAYQGDAGSQNALRFAIQMAEKYGATLTGVYVQAPDQYESQIRHWIGDDFLQTVRRVQLEAVTSIESSFRQFMKENGSAVTSEWISTDGPVGLTLARISRTFDLLITGQFEGAVRVGGRAVQPEELVVRAGKPVLMIPKDYKVRPFKEEAVVAWDGSRYAARALTDAMHILETKKGIDLLTVSGSGEPPVLGWAESHDVLGHLHRHAIKARHVQLEAQGGLGRTILDYCDEHDPDVLIMGAFGRGKLGAMLFGGVSQYVLEHQSVPILMSH